MAKRISKKQIKPTEIKSNVPAQVFSKKYGCLITQSTAYFDEESQDWLNKGIENSFVDRANRTIEKLQIGEGGADIEMRIEKTIAGIYFVSFHLFRTDKNKIRTMVENLMSPCYPFNSAEDIHKEFGEQMAGKNVTI
jgi:hypothetical protein